MLDNKKLYIGFLLGFISAWLIYPLFQKYPANPPQTNHPPNIAKTEKINPAEGLPSNVKAGEERIYENARFGYSTKYPSDILFPQGESDNGDGQTFLSKDAKAKLTVYGANNIDSISLEDEFESEFRGDMENDSKRVVSYKRLNKNWFVVSGFEKGNIFYIKRFLVGDCFITFDFSYPESEKAKWDSVLSKMAANFNPGKGEGW